MLRWRIWVENQQSNSNCEVLRSRHNQAPGWRAACEGEKWPDMAGDVTRG